jgi:hypothetical protein
MKAAVIRAAMLSVLTASASYAATDPAGASRPNPDAALSGGEGAPGGQGVRIASAAASTFLFVREASQSPLVTVGEGGEGRRGRRFHGRHFHHYPGHYNYYRYYNRPYYNRPYYNRPYYGRPYHGRPYHGRPYPRYYDYPRYRYW